MPGMAFATGCTTLVGQYLGAKRPEDAERCAYTSRNMGLAWRSHGAIFIFFFGKYIAMLYTNDMSVVLASALVLKIYAFAQPFQSIQFILAGGLRGAGDTKYPLLYGLGHVDGPRGSGLVLRKRGENGPSGAWSEWP